MGLAFDWFVLASRACHTGRAVKRDEFEARVLDLWMTSVIPLTYANVQYHTRVSRRKVRAWLDEMVREGALDVDSSDEGELLFSVPGAARAANGPRTMDELVRLQSLRASVAAGSAGKERVRPGRARRDDDAKARRAPTSPPSSPGALESLDEAVDLPALRRAYQRRGASEVARALARGARQDLAQGPGKGRKSMVLSGGLSFLLGPIGWLYAGSFREAIPAAFAYLLIMSVVPMFLLMPILGLAMPLSGLAGVVYAWQHNQDGKRGSILGSESD